MDPRLFGLLFLLVMFGVLLYQQISAAQALERKRDEHRRRLQRYHAMKRRGGLPPADPDHYWS